MRILVSRFFPVMQTHPAFVTGGVVGGGRPWGCEALTKCGRHSGDGGRAPKRRRGVTVCTAAEDGKDWGRDAEFMLDAGSVGAAENSEGGKEFDWKEWSRGGEAAEVPMLPFSPEEIFLPGESKHLHIYEARFLALFERSVVRFGKRFAHVLYAADRGALAAHGTVARVESWRRLDVGVLIEVEGVARLRVSALNRATPFWAGACTAVCDGTADVAELREREGAALRAFNDVIRLCVRLGVSAARQYGDGKRGRGKEEVPAAPALASENGLFALNEEAKIAAWEVRMRVATMRAADGERFEWGEYIKDNETAVRRATAVSFAAWNFFPSTAAERQRALEGRDTVARLDAVVAGLEGYAKSLAAKSAVREALEKREL